jgi:hypothetical protein
MKSAADLTGEIPMTRVVLDTTMLEKLQSLRERAELVDPQGRLIGFFDPMRVPEVIDSHECPYTEEELRRAEQEPGGRTLEEILADLEARS